MRSLTPLVRRTVPLLLLCLAFWCTPTRAERTSLPRCPVLSDIQQLDITYFTNSENNYFASSEYFCGADAPDARRCHCTASDTCRYAPSPFAGGGDIGVCGCCAAWVIVLVALICILALASVVVGIYFFCCQNRWWCDGAPKPYTYCVPKAGSAVIVPADSPFPSGLFRGYRSSNFMNYDPSAAAEIAPVSATTARGAEGVTASVSAPPTRHEATGLSRTPHRTAAQPDPLAHRVRQRHHTTEEPPRTDVSDRRHSSTPQGPLEDAAAGAARRATSEPGAASPRPAPVTSLSGAVPLAASTAFRSLASVPAPPPHSQSIAHSHAAASTGALSVPHTPVDVSIGPRPASFALQLSLGAASSIHSPPDERVFSSPSQSDEEGEHGNAKWSNSNGARPPSRRHRRVSATGMPFRESSTAASDTLTERRGSAQTRLSHSHLGSRASPASHQL